MKSIRGKYKSLKTGVVERFDSSFEWRRFIFLDASPEVERWTKRHRIRIPYRHRRKKHYYIPDILVTFSNGSKHLEEVKGFVRDPDIFELKNAAARSWCKAMNVQFCILYEPDLEK